MVFPNQNYSFTVFVAWTVIISFSFFLIYKKPLIPISLFHPHRINICILLSPQQFIWQNKSVGIHNFSSLNNLLTKDIHPEGQHNVLFLVSYFIKTALHVNLINSQFWNIDVTQKGYVHKKVTFCLRYIRDTPTDNSGSSAHSTRDRGWPLIFKPLILKNEINK